MALVAHMSASRDKLYLEVAMRIVDETLTVPCVINGGCSPAEALCSHHASRLHHLAVTEIPYRQLTKCVDASRQKFAFQQLFAVVSSVACIYSQHLCFITVSRPES